MLPSGDRDAGDASGIVLARQMYPRELPIIPLMHRPVFPRMTVPVQIEQPELIEAVVSQANSDHKLVGLVLVREAAQDPAEPERPVRGDALHKVGVIAEIDQIAQYAENGVQVMLSATERFKIKGIVQNDPTIIARVDYLSETSPLEAEELKAYVVSVVQNIKELVALNPLHKEELSMFMSRSDLHVPGRLADIAAALTTAEGRELQDILETLDIGERLNKVLVLIRKEIDISRIQVKIGKQIEEKISSRQRDFFLREQLKAIKKELGIEKEGKEAEVDKFIERIEKLTLTAEARQRIDEEIEKLKLIEPASPEFSVTRNYVDWLTALPWGIHSEDTYEIAEAEKVLNRDHFGLEDVKERILEFLSVGIKTGSISGTILCFVGPPGVGKTSIGRSIAESMGRTFYRFSLGGMRDEAEIKGHRRTYIGALPGKFIQAMKTCGTQNPVIMLDEIDKIGASYRGDPASALLEVLDPEQNDAFLDHYLDVRFDLSNVLFICTANQTDSIPLPLLDRMEIIHLPGYILEEKLSIARRFLIPKQLRAHGVTRREVFIGAPAIRAIIDGYAREPGVRTLEQQIRKVLRKCVKRIVEKKAKDRLVIDPEDVSRLLGKPVFDADHAYPHNRPGVVTGLAWTRLGGETLHVEANAVETGKPAFRQTGQLGDVMVESSEIAYTVIRAQCAPGDTFFERHSIHLHVPAGATPKDGPSAGITMAAALYSLHTGLCARPSLAMTGELTLTGRVMPIGGVKEKTIAAKRSSIREIILPVGNRRDYEELPAHVRKGLTVHYAETLDDVLDIAIGKKRRGSPPESSRDIRSANLCQARSGFFAGECVSQWMVRAACAISNVF